MDLELGGARVVITGASRGVGRVIAEQLLAEGASVAICARGTARSADRTDAPTPTLDELAAELGADGGTVSVSQVDVADHRALRDWIETVAGEIVDWNDGIKNSHAIGDLTEGVGAQRQCDIVPNGKMTLTLSGEGDTPSCTMKYDYEPKGGPLAALFGPLLDRQMFKAFQGSMENLESAAQSRD